MSGIIRSGRRRLGKERAQLEAVVNRLESLDRGLNEVAELLTLAGEEGDEAAVAEVVRDLENCARVVADLEFQRMFSGELDASNAFRRYSGRFRRHRGAGLGGDAAADVSALGRAARLQNRVAGSVAGRSGGHQERQHSL
jgi:hypothetical protein